MWPRQRDFHPWLHPRLKWFCARVWTPRPNVKLWFSSYGNKHLWTVSRVKGCAHLLHSQPSRVIPGKEIHTGPEAYLCLLGRKFQDHSFPGCGLEEEGPRLWVDQPLGPGIASLQGEWEGSRWLEQSLPKQDISDSSVHRNDLGILLKYEIRHMRMGPGILHIERALRWRGCCCSVGPHFEWQGCSAQSPPRSEGGEHWYSIHMKSVVEWTNPNCG